MLRTEFIGLFLGYHMTTDYWYRFENFSCGNGVVKVHLRKLPVIRYTPCGAWLDIGLKERFVLTTATKRWAAPTPEEALKSFKARKKRQVQILSNQLNDAKTALIIAEADSSIINSRSN